MLSWWRQETAFVGRKRVWLETGSICIYGNEDSHSWPWKQEGWASRSRVPGPAISWSCCQRATPPAVPSVPRSTRKNLLLVQQLEHIGFFEGVHARSLIQVQTQLGYTFSTIVCKVHSSIC